MPKFISDQNATEKAKKLGNDRVILKSSMYQSAVITYFIAVAFFVISFLFNGKLISSWVTLVDANIAADDGPNFITIIDSVIKILSVVLFFFFGLISLGNFRELKGYIVTWKEMVILLVLALLQATIDVNVFFLSIVGILLILVYFYFLQGKITKE